MNERVKNLWVEALESGEYKQTTSRLKDEGGYCCLGVLCDLYQKDTGQGEWGSNSDDCYTNGDQGFRGQGEDYFERGVPPQSVAQWAGLDRPNPHVSYSNLPEETKLTKADYVFGVENGDVEFSLASLNDRGNDFSVIAIIIEENL